MRYQTKYQAVSFVFAVIFASAISIRPAAADAAFDAAIRAATPDAGAEFFLLRCSGFYRSLHLRVGEDNIGEETYAQLTNAERELGINAALFRAQSEQYDQDTAIDTVMTDIQNIAEVYLARYEAHFAATGTAWTGDEVWQNDGDHCRGVLDRLP